MATAHQVQLQLGQWPEYYREGISSDSAEKVSQVLQENHDKFHIFFNDSGFHNHIVHQMLTMWALNATPSQLQREYDNNKSYQRPLKGVTSKLENLHDPETFIAHLGPEQHYNDFLQFFRQEIENSSWQDVIQKYVLSGDKRAETMFVRMHAGFLHPLIHLGFGIEFQQPAIIAEALAQAACHDAWIGDLLQPAEEQAKMPKAFSSILQLLDELQVDPKIRSAVHWSDGNKIRDGLLARCPTEILSYISRVQVKPEELELRTAEMTNAVAYYTSGAQNPQHQVKFDFYFIHCLNSSIFYSSFLKQPWLTTAQKVRLLEWKIRMDLVMYASRKSPEVRWEDVTSYLPKRQSGWEGVEDRVCGLEDDGHASKLIRALVSGERICRPFEGREEFRVKGGDWLKMGHMAIDSVEGVSEDTWVRSAGFKEAWADVPLRASL